MRHTNTSDMDWNTTWSCETVWNHTTACPHQCDSILCILVFLFNNTTV